VGGTLCVAYVDVVTETPHDVSTSSNTAPSAAAHDLIAVNTPLSIENIGWFLTEAGPLGKRNRTEFIGSKPDRAMLTGNAAGDLSRLALSANWQQIEPAWPARKRSTIRRSLVFGRIGE
jgi:hypothetical protein